MSVKTVQIKFSQLSVRHHQDVIQDLLLSKGLCVDYVYCLLGILCAKVGIGGMIALGCSSSNQENEEAEWFSCSWIFGLWLRRNQNSLTWVCPLPRLPEFGYGNLLRHSESVPGFRIPSTEDIARYPCSEALDRSGSRS